MIEYADYTCVETNSKRVSALHTKIVLDHYNKFFLKEQRLARKPYFKRFKSILETYIKSNETGDKIETVIFGPGCGISFETPNNSGTYVIDLIFDFLETNENGERSLTLQFPSMWLLGYGRTRIKLSNIKFGDFCTDYKKFSEEFGVEYHKNIVQIRNYLSGYPLITEAVKVVPILKTLIKQLNIESKNKKEQLKIEATQSSKYLDKHFAKK